MLIVLLSPLLIGAVVFTFFVLTSYRNILLVLKTIHWTLVLWLLGIAILAGEILRAGLLVIDKPSLLPDAHWAWTVWMVCILFSTGNPILLFPATALPVWFLSYPEARMLLNYGLVRLGWLEPIHSPLELLLRTWIREYDVARIDVPKWMPLRINEEVLAKLRPTQAWVWLPNLGRQRAHT